MIAALIGANSGAFARFFVDRALFGFDGNGGSENTFLTSDLPWIMSNRSGNGSAGIHPESGSGSTLLTISTPTSGSPDPLYNQFTLTNSDGIIITIEVVQAGNPQ